MNKTISITLITFWTLVTSVLYGQIKKENLDTLVNRLGESFIKNKQAVGLSIGVYNNGSTYFYNYGTTEREEIKLPTQNTVYEIGSITKAFVSLILANAVIEKKVTIYPKSQSSKYDCFLFRVIKPTASSQLW